MANHTITVKSRHKGGTGGAGGKGGLIEKTGKKTSTLEFFQNKNSLGAKTIRGIQMARQLNVGAAVSSMGGGASMALAVAQEAGSMLRQGFNIYASIMEAKSGETMRYHNLRQGVRAMTQPISFLKTGLFDYGIVAPLQINRQNQMLEYDRQLTGSLINGRLYQTYGTT